MTDYYIIAAIGVINGLTFWLGWVFGKIDEKINRLDRRLK